MIARVSLAQDTMNRQAFTWSDRRLKYDLKIPENISRLVNEAPSTEDPLNEDSISKLLAILPADIEPPRKLNPLLLNASRIIGALWIWSSCTGCFITPFNQFHYWTGSYLIATLVTAMPVYTISVLLVFFGQSIGADLYAYVTSCGEYDTKLPVAAKYYPKCFMLSTVLNFLMVPFSYAAATELVYSGFQDYQWAKSLLPTLIGLSITGLIFLSLSAVHNFSLLMLTKFATHAGGENTRLLAKTNEKIDQYKNSINYMDGPALEKELRSMGGGKRKNLLGVGRSEFENIIGHRGNIETHSKPGRDWYSWFKCCVRGSDDAEASTSPDLSVF